MIVDAIDFAEITQVDPILENGNEPPPHPLLNPDSKHYTMVDGVEAIERLEQMYSQHELAIWAKITAMKYRLRMGHKDGIHKEAHKIETYEAYYKYLEDKING